MWESYKKAFCKDVDIKMVVAIAFVAELTVPEYTSTV